MFGFCFAMQCFCNHLNVEKISCCLLCSQSPCLVTVHVFCGSSSRCFGLVCIVDFLTFTNGGLPLALTV